MTMQYYKIRRVLLKRHEIRRVTFFSRVDRHFLLLNSVFHQPLICVSWRDKQFSCFVSLTRNFCWNVQFNFRIMVWTGTDEDPPFFHDHPTMGPMVRMGYAVFVQPAIWIRKNVIEPNRTSEPEAWYHRLVSCYIWDF